MSMSRLVRSRAAAVGLISGVLLIASLATQAGAAQTTQVRVVNTPTEAVPVTAQGITQVAGTVSIGNTPTVNVGNLPATQQVAGTINVGNLPATQQVAGTINVGNFPSSVPLALVGRVSGDGDAGEDCASIEIPDGKWLLTNIAATGYYSPTAVVFISYTTKIAPSQGVIQVVKIPMSDVGDYPVDNTRAGTVEIDLRLSGGDHQDAQIGEVYNVLGCVDAPAGEPSEAAFNLVGVGG